MRLAEGPLAAEELGRTVGLASRPLVVLTTALRAMGLLAVDSAKRLELTRWRENTCCQASHFTWAIISAARRRPQAFWKWSSGCEPIDRPTT